MIGSVTLHHRYIIVHCGIILYLVLSILQICECYISLGEWKDAEELHRRASMQHYSESEGSGLSYDLSKMQSVLMISVSVSVLLISVSVLMISVSVLMISVSVLMISVSVLLISVSVLLISVSVLMIL